LKRAIKEGKALVSIKIRYIRLAGYLLLITSIIVFLLGWLNWYIGLPASLLLLFAFYKITRDMKEDQKELSISKSTLIILLVIVVTWVLLSGVGGAFPQKEDMHWRNAIFHDLINYSWPVHYTDGFDSSLTYYIAFWLIPALFGKGITALFGNQAGWIGANVMTAVYCSVIIFIVILLLMSYLNATSKKKMLLVTAIVIFFSGMDIIPVLLYIFSGGTIHYGVHLEWWTYIEYSSNTSQLGWVYNQAIPAWLVTGLLLHETKVNHYAFLGLLLLPFGPLPFLGVAYLMIATGVRKGIAAIKDGKLKSLILEICSLPNLIGCLVLVPIFYLYFSSNMTASNSNNFWNEFYPFSYFGFLLTEFMVIVILIWRFSFQKPFFLASVIGLIFIPFFKFGAGQDFCMRVSVPLLFVVMLYTMDYLLNHMTIVANKQQLLNKKVIPLLIVLLIGATNPLNEYRASYLQIKESGNNCTSIFADDFKTLNNGDLDRDNFITKYSSQTFFYQYLAKGDKK
jgi:hypothetical protein